MTCAQLGLTAPDGTACRSHFNAGGSDAIVAQIAATAPKIAAVLQGIRARSPMARILLVGYPDVLPRTGNGCYPLVPLSPDDVRYFDGLIVQTNTMLAEQAAANGAEFVDTYSTASATTSARCRAPAGSRGSSRPRPRSRCTPTPSAMESMARSVLRVLDGRARRPC